MASEPLSVALPKDSWVYIGTLKSGVVRIKLPGPVYYQSYRKAAANPESSLPTDFSKAATVAYAVIKQGYGYVVKGDMHMEWDENMDVYMYASGFDGEVRVEL